MRLDRTRIVIVERRQPELLDLAFIVLRDFFFPSIGLFLALALPLAFLNHWLIEWMAADLIESSTIWRFIVWSAVLVYVQAPFAGVLMTAYLGKATFHDEPTIRELVWDVLTMWFRIFWTQLFLRGVLLFPALLWMIDRAEPAPSAIEAVLFVLLIVLFFWRSLRPYIMEIVLLERSPLWTREQNKITVGKRSSRLHGPNSGDLFGRGVCMLPVTLILTLAIFGSLWFFVATFTNDWNWGKAIVYCMIPASFWMMAIYTTVFRFLSYLDLRIRREGWEVELKMRAEANRLLERTVIGRS